MTSVPVRETPSVSSPKATRKEWIGLAVLTLPCILYSMDLTVLNLAVPALTADLKPSGAQLLWILDIYGFFVAGSLITMGTLGDRIGRRKLLMIGAMAFGGASVLAALANTAVTLIAARALLGIAGATLAPSTLSLLRNMFLDPQQRTFAVGVWATGFSLGGALGPLLGGLMLQHFWWGSVFLLAIPVMVLILIVGPWLLPEFKDPNPGKPDIISTVMSIAAVLGIIYGFKQIATDGWGLAPVATIVGGLAVGALFVQRQRLLADPFLDLRLFQQRAFSVALGTNMFAIFSSFGAFLLIAQYLQLVLGLSPLDAGLWTLPSSVGFIVGSMSAPLLSRWLRPATAIAICLGLAAIGMAIMAQIGGPSSLSVVVVGSIALALGISPVVTLGTDLIVSSAPPERAGAASAISETGAELGGALGIALFGSLATAVYRSIMGRETFAGIAPETVEAARNTLGGAIEIAHGLSRPAGNELARVARDAFTQSLQMSALIGCVMLVGVAVISWWLLQKTRQSALSGNIRVE